MCKVCSKCGEIKQEFHVHGKNNLEATYCKECYLFDRREYYQRKKNGWKRPKPFKHICNENYIDYDTFRCWLKRRHDIGISELTEKTKIELLYKYIDERKEPTLYQKFEKENVNYDAFRWWLKKHKGLEIGELTGLPFDRYYLPYIEEYKEFKR